MLDLQYKELKDYTLLKNKSLKLIEIELERNYEVQCLKQLDKDIINALKIVTEVINILNVESEEKLSYYTDLICSCISYLKKGTVNRGDLIEKLIKWDESEIEIVIDILKRHCIIEYTLFGLLTLNIKYA